MAKIHLNNGNYLDVVETKQEIRILIDNCSRDYIEVNERIVGFGLDNDKVDYTTDNVYIMLNSISHWK